MKSIVRSTCLALVAGGAVALVQAQGVPELVTITQVMETPASKVVLPLSSTSSLVMPPCGDCAPKSYPVTPATRYYVGKNEVTVEELRSVTLSNPDVALSVAYVVKTGELVSVTADVVPTSNTR